ncbi:MAG: hypothetical protein ABJG88_02950 [Litorimonas sp.]
MKSKFVFMISTLVFLPIVAVAKPFADMTFEAKIDYMQSKLAKRGYFTPYKHLYRRYQKPTTEWNKNFIDEYEKAVSCMSALETRENKVSKICFQTQVSNAGSRQNHFRLEWFEDNKSCQAIKAYYLSDETMIIGNRNINFAAWVDEDEKVSVSVPNSRGGYHRYTYDKNTNEGTFFYKEQAKVRYSNCMDYKEFEANGFQKPTYKENPRNTDIIATPKIVRTDKDGSPIWGFEVYHENGLIKATKEFSTQQEAIEMAQRLSNTIPN